MVCNEQEVLVVVTPLLTSALPPSEIQLHKHNFIYTHAPTHTMKLHRKSHTHILDHTEYTHTHTGLHRKSHTHNTHWITQKITHTYWITQNIHTHIHTRLHRKSHIHTHWITQKIYTHTQCCQSALHILAVKFKTTASPICMQQPPFFSNQNCTIPPHLLLPPKIAPSLYNFYPDYLSICYCVSSYIFLVTKFPMGPSRQRNLFSGNRKKVLFKIKQSMERVYSMC